MKCKGYLDGAGDRRFLRETIRSVSGLQSKKLEEGSAEMLMRLINS